MRRFVAALVLLALGGCGGGQEPPPAATPAAPDIVRFCGDAGPGWKPLGVPGGVEAATLGSGPGVVLLNESDNDACAWTATASSLAGAGYRVAVFQYTSTTAADERASTAEALAVAHALGGKPQLVGASLGGRIVFEAAAKAPGAVAAIASLSGERTVEDYGDILPAVRRVSAPVLYLGSRQDPLTDGVKQPRQIRAALPSKEQTFQLVSGSEHGVLLLPGLGARLRGFLDAHR
jgi:pimeloyl-ACP methyl ester carboxylesterase